jgi:hypothetical protein
MSATIEQPTKEQLQGPISEKTRAILDAIDRIDKKLDVIIDENASWKVALIRSIKQFLSLLDQPASRNPGEQSTNTVDFRRGKNTDTYGGGSSGQK